MRPLFFIVSLGRSGRSNPPQPKGCPTSRTFQVHSTRCKTDAVSCMQDTEHSRGVRWHRFCYYFHCESHSLWKRMGCRPNDRFPADCESGAIIMISDAEIFKP